MVAAVPMESRDHCMLIGCNSLSIQLCALHIHYNNSSPSPPLPSPLRPSPPPTVHDAATDVIGRLSQFTSSAQDVLFCDVGVCHSLSIKYDQFSSAVCNDIVQGLDIYWLTLCAVLAISLVVVLVSLILASRFIDLELEKSNRSNRFHMPSAIIRQIRAIFWFVLSTSSNLWLVIAISEDEYFHESFCLGQPEGCCPSCVWGFGILFLILSLLVGGGGRVYQCVVLHRINSMLLSLTPM